MRQLIIVTTVGFAFAMMIVAVAVKIGKSTYPETSQENTSSPRASAQAPIEAMACDQGPPNSPSTATYDLDENSADWGVYCEGSPEWVKASVATPSIDGKSLQCSITGGTPYSNMHCYRNLLPEPSASAFTLTLSFWLSPTTTFNNQGASSVIQALEFTMNKWYQSERYEFALQWQNVGDGAPQWRYWDPHQSEPWVSMGVTDTLDGEEWHFFTLEGEIIDGQVHYQRFRIDQRSYDLDTTVPPASASGEPDRLAIAIQLDGNFEESPYNVFIDEVSFVRKPRAQIHLPLILK